MRDKGNNMVKKTLLVCLMTFGLVLQGCGFHMRGSFELDKLPPEMKNMAIQGIARNSQLAVSLRNALKSSGVNVVEKSQAGAVLRITKNQRYKRVLTVSSTSGKVNEFELYYKVGFEMRNKEGAEIVKRQEVSVVRDYTFTESQVYGKAREEQVMYREMTRDVVSQIIRLIQAQAG
jgi:LPS-assembly lipoprotein